MRQEDIINSHRTVACWT